MTVLALIRHAPTVWNAEGRLQGQADIDLSPAGRDALAGWRLPAEMQGYRRLSSPLKRTVETATALFGSVPDTDPRLVEKSWGDWEGHVLAELRAELGATMVAMEARGIDLRPPGGESPRDVQVRMAPFLKAVADRGEATVAVTHRGVMRSIYALATGWDMTDKPRDKLRDGCVHVFDLDNGGIPRVSRLNVSLES